MVSIAVVGAGLIGSAAANWLAAEGYDVTVFEADPQGLPASAGNAGLIALPEIAPIASPGIVTAVPKWLVDPLGPLTVRWGDLPSLAPWLIRFIASATPHKADRVRAALATLMRTALEDHRELARRAEVADYLRETGFLSLHDTPASLKAGRAEAEVVSRLLSYEFELLSASAARTLVPQLEGRFEGAISSPAYRMVTDPLEVLRALQERLRRKGRLTTARVVNLRSGASGVEVVTEDRALRRFDRVVVAAGVWSRALVRGLGLKVLLETERGYNTTYRQLDWNLPMPVGFADHGFIASPLAGGLRVGGAVELARPDAPANFARARAMRAKMRRFVPLLPEEGGTEWMGCRPSTPDSLPVIGRHPGDGRIVFAFGHGHLGLTLSAVTARHVTALVAAGETPIPELSPFGIERFQ